MKTVVLGGYGNFGARICRALADSPDIELVIAGRDAKRATQLAAELGGRASAMRLDLSQPDLTEVLRNIGAQLVIHTAGPFQQQSYTVPLAVAAAGAHYIDLADGRRFVCDFPQALDAAFRKNGRIAITGASTVPALSSAVVTQLSERWRSLDSIDICIAPAQTAPRGIATMAAVLDYCGAPIQVWQDGKWVTRHGWADLTRIHFARLRPRIGALCDIPDLELFPLHYTGLRSTMFRAALEIGLSQRALAAMAWLRKTGFINRPERFAGLLNRTANGLDFLGSALGGMVVRVAGTDANGRPVRRAWHIAADDDHGPEIPCMAAILLARRLAQNTLPGAGAYTSVGQLNLSDFAPEFAKWCMLTDIVEET
ncbi:Saccharopine dehydrogenase-related proteins [Collimonas arenae]|uniref:Saccharopine dehydrogenase-related proteins n=1 Tax=Collimonas arenae TaxID=279058 RepID=A0A0A1FAJ1_9BURK|nr:saccharopine dehydrogenase NADP-binding domain-containing protein [Collimonas arenae]AIY41571.1 Saccharopine dehydrogenase-related proteins [Collimonas arenae]